MYPLKAFEWGYGSLHISQLNSGKGHVRIWVFDFNMKAQSALFSKDLTTWLTREPFNILMDIIIMLPKILLKKKTFSTNLGVSLNLRKTYQGKEICLALKL